MYWDVDCFFFILRDCGNLVWALVIDLRAMQLRCGLGFWMI